MNFIINAVSPTAVLSNLADYGVTAVNLTNATDALAAFLLIQNAPQNAIVARKVDTMDIHPKVKEGKDLLDLEGDNITNTMLDDNHTLFELWNSARKIIHFPHGTTIGEGYVLKPDGSPIYNAKITFMPQGFVLYSLLDGSFRYPHFPHGVTTPTAAAREFQDETLPATEIKQGKTVAFKFILSPM